MFPTRLCLRVADDTSGRVTLDDHRWGRQAMKFKNPGRAILRAGQYQALQVYKVTTEQEAEWLSGLTGEPLSPLPEEEMLLVKRAIEETEGKMSIPLLVKWGLREREARRIVETYEARGWLEQDTMQGNARVVTSKLADLVSSCQTCQTLSSPQMERQTAIKPCQTLNMAGA